MSLLEEMTPGAVFAESLEALCDVPGRAWTSSLVRGVNQDEGNLILCILSFGVLFQRGLGVADQIKMHYHDLLNFLV